MSCNVFSTRTWCRRQRVHARASSTRAKNTSARRSRDKKKTLFTRYPERGTSVAKSKLNAVSRARDRYVYLVPSQTMVHELEKKTSRMVFNFNPSSIVTKRLIIKSFHSGTTLAQYTTAYVVYWFFTRYTYTLAIPNVQRYSNFTNIYNHDQNSNEMWNHDIQWSLWNLKKFCTTRVILINVQVIETVSWLTVDCTYIQ